MKNFLSILIHIVIVVILFSSTTIITAQETTCNITSRLLRQVAPAMVSLTIDSTSRQGSGVLISSDGLILTAAHVVRDADIILVATIARATDVATNRYRAVVVQVHEDLDFAVLQITQTTNRVAVTNLSLPYVSLSSVDLQFGDCVSVLGYPLASNSTLSASDGRVSQATSLRNFEMFTVTAAFGNGQSGGGVIDSNGVLRGIARNSVDNGQFGLITPMSEICPRLEDISCNSSQQSNSITAPETYSTFRPASLSAARQYSSIWNNFTFIDMTRPGSQNYRTTLSTNQTVNWSLTWCADTNTRKWQILEPLSVAFFINDSEVSSSSILTTDDNLCRRWITVVSFIRSGATVTLEIRYSLAERIFDGTAYYEAGDYTQTITVRVP